MATPKIKSIGINDLPFPLKVDILDGLPTVTLQRVAGLEPSNHGPGSLYDAVNAVLHKKVCIDISKGQHREAIEYINGELFIWRERELFSKDFLLYTKLDDLDKLHDLLHHTKEVFIACEGTKMASYSRARPADPAHKLSAEQTQKMEKFIESLPNLQVLDVACTNVSFWVNKKLRKVSCRGRCSTFLVDNSKLSGSFVIRGLGRMPNFSGMKLINLHQLNISAMHINTVDAKQLALPKLAHLKITGLQRLQTVKNLNSSFLPNLASLKIIHCSGATIEGPIELPKLKSIVIQMCLLTEIPQFINMPELQCAYFDKNKIREINENFLQCRNLEFLDLSSNGIIRVQNLHFLKKLLYLSLVGNHLFLIQGLQELKELVYLNLALNKIKYLENLDGLTKMETLLIFGNPLFRIRQDFSDFRKLKHVAVSESNLKDIEPLYKATALKRLEIGSTMIKEIGDLSHWPNLEILHAEALKLYSVKSGKLEIFLEKD